MGKSPPSVNFYPLSFEQNISFILCLHDAPRCTVCICSAHHSALLDGLCKEGDQQPLLEAAPESRRLQPVVPARPWARVLCCRTVLGRWWEAGVPGRGPSPGAESADHLSLLGSAFQTPNKVFKQQKLTEALKIIICII